MAANPRPAKEGDPGGRGGSRGRNSNACVIKLEATLLSSSALVAASFLSRLQNLYVSLHFNPF